MRRVKLLMTTAVLMSAMMMGGCGEEAYTLTESEEKLIVDYSAHVVAKYNTYQKEGLAYVWPEKVQEDEPETKPVESEEETVAEVPDTTGSGSSEEIVYAENAVTLNEIFGKPGISLSYLGAKLADSYEDSYYSMYPDAGKRYLVLGIDVKNESSAPVDVDYVSDMAKFRVTLNGGIKATSEITLLLQDFSSFDAILDAGETRETILMFQIPDTVDSIERVELVVETDDSYQIIL